MFCDFPTLTYLILIRIDIRSCSACPVSGETSKCGEMLDSLIAMTA